MKTTLLALLMMFAFTSQRALALVDLKNANYADAWMDLSIAGTGYDLKVVRAYNSRTLYNGIFGFGWCSDFETSLEITAEGNLRLTECGAGQETLYLSKGFSEKDVEKTVKTIIERTKNENTTANAAYFSELERRLKVESALRSEYASKYNITRPITDKSRFYANGRDVEFIEKMGNYYSRTTVEGSIQKFTMQGKLEKIYDRNGNYLTFTYDGKRLRDVTDNNGRKIAFSYYENGKVKAITGPGGIHAEYKFKNLNDLVWVKAANAQVFTYDYDDLHNLTKVTFPDKTTKELTYNKNYDLVTSYKDPEGCLETYDYKESEDKPREHFWATVVKKCKEKVILRAKYEFWYEMKSDKTAKYLKRSKTQENDATTDVTYNELGKPMVVARNGKNTKFEYYDNGLLKKKVTPDGVATVLQYDANLKKVNKVLRGNKSSEFFYDTRGNLVKASNSDGQKISLSYDARGRIAIIEDQAKRKVAIKYEERFGKPYMIEREGVGSITVSYGKAGEIEKVTSPAGPSVAIQVASTFSNLLDLLQPTGVSLSF
jgi:YD repeat-containing protein